MLDETKLKEIADFWDGDNWTTEEGRDSFWLKDPYGEEAQKIEGIFWDELILGSRFNIAGVKTMMDNGYEVFAGESDSFGLLTVCVSKDSKTFIFG